MVDWLIAKQLLAKTFYFPVMALVHVIGISTRNLSFEKKNTDKNMSKRHP
jgi:hypothetical protein